MWKRRDATISSILTIVAVLFHPSAEQWWFRTAVEGRDVPQLFGRVDLGSLMFYPFEFAWFAVLGVAVGLIIRSPRPLRWGAACGTFGALVNFGLTTNIFYPQTPWLTKFFDYLEYLIPIVAAAIGAVAGAAIKRRARPNEHAG